MRTLVATALVAYASADETSLMQEKVKRSGKLSADSQTSRQASTAKLLETAVSMIKNGVTPDVITFVDSTNQEINEEVLAAIQREHDTDQAYIHSLCQDFLNAVQNLEDQAAAIAVHDDNRLAASEAHQNCRKEEAFKCAHSRRCEEQLRQKWITVKHEESIMREIHGHIHDEWCIHPPFFAEIDVWLTNPFNWADMSPYPILDLPQDVRDFRQVSVTHFNDYMAQKIVVERAWHEYNEKLVECSGLEEALEAQTPICDQAQLTLREHACQHAVHNREAREEFGQEWDRINRLYDEAVIAKSANEQDRKNEWETLKIVQCLLDHVHSTVVDSIETGAPCPTIDSDEEGVTLAIEDCHIVTRGCDEGSMTAHLCLEWCEKPPIPPLPPVEEPACTPAYIAREQGSFLEAIQASYREMLSNNEPYPDDALGQYNTVLSPAGWAGCAAPLVCVDCAGLETVLPIPTYENAPRTCHLHEEYLSPGQSNFDSFRCLDGTCIGMEGRCNGYANCGDESDEMGCDAETEVFVPAYLAQSIECPADFLTDVYFQCTNSRCVEKIGLCNGHDNCGDNSDEAHCSGSIHVTTEATSGRTITVETLESHTGVFHDREYSFDSLGDFAGKPFIKYSNDDKATDHAHVMTKLRTEKPLTVFIVKLEGHSLPWLEAEGYAPSAHAGVTFSGVRETRHKEWDPTLLTTDTFTASEVYSKTFEAGTISIPGNNGGDGSFLVFLAEPGFEPRPVCCEAMTASCLACTNGMTEDEFCAQNPSTDGCLRYDSRLSAYWEHGNCGVHGNDWNWGWCGAQAGNCPATVQTDICASGTAELAEFHGAGGPALRNYHRAGCDYIWHAQYVCTEPIPMEECQCEVVNSLGHLPPMDTQGPLETITTMGQWVNTRNGDTSVRGGGISSLIVRKVGGSGHCAVRVSNQLVQNGQPASPGSTLGLYEEGEYPYPMRTGNDNIRSLIMDCVTFD